MATQPTDWIEWKGGECPVALGTAVETRRKSGCQQRYVTNERDYWDGSPWFRDAYLADPNTDIIAYRVVQS